MRLAVLLLVPVGMGFVVEFPHVGTKLGAGVPEWDSIMPDDERQAKRSKQVRDKMKELREYKKQGRRYDGVRLEAVEEADNAKKETPQQKIQSIMPEAQRQAERSMEVRKKIATLRKLKSEGKRYDGKDAVEAAIDRFVADEDDAERIAEEAGFSQLMNDAEQFFGKKTSGVGGTWTKSEEDDEMHTPKVGTWGAYPRPRDISKAYGGGKEIGVGAYVNETEQKVASERTAALLARVRSKAASDQKIVEKHRDQIEAAIDFAKKRVLRGNPLEGLEKLEAIKEVCTPKTELGATALLELALAYEATGNRDKAKDVYGELSASPISEIKRRAEQLNFGFKAEEFLDVGAYKGSKAEEDQLQVYDFDWSGLRRESNVYAQSVGVTLSTSTSSSGKDALEVTLDDARDLVRRAALGGETFASPDRVKRALKAFDLQCQLHSLEISDNRTALDLLNGTWTILFRKDAYEPKGTTVTFDAVTQRIHRRIPFMNGAAFGDWDGAIQDNIESTSVTGLRDGGGALTAFLDKRWHVELIFFGDDGTTCALKTNGNDLLLCKRLSPPPTSSNDDDDKV